jgi:DNA adenine methylase
MYKSPLRYPGGKSRAVTLLAGYVPPDVSEYREPFVGGGSLFLYLKQHYPHRTYWINDLNAELYHFWQQAQHDSVQLAAEVAAIKQTRTDGRDLFYELLHTDTATLAPRERAVRFFVLNRISFSGTVEAGGYSRYAFQHRFTPSSIERLARLGPLLEGVRITNYDYRQVLGEGGESCFIFLDPPYYTATPSRLYGRRGVLHTSFDHATFAQAMHACPHRWLITYDDSPAVRELFPFAYWYEWQLQYGMNNYKQHNAEKGAELMLINYAVAHQQAGVSIAASSPRQLTMALDDEQ